MPIMIQVTTKEQELYSPCPICCKEKPAFSSMRAIEMLSRELQRMYHTCPFCQLEIPEEEMLALLGRPFQPRTVVQEVDSVEIDELTLG